MRKREKIYKKILALVLAVILCSSNMSLEVFASNREATPRATYLNIPDKDLRSSIWKAIDGTEGKEDSIPTSKLGDIEKITGVFEPVEAISDITGLEYLTGIAELKLKSANNNLRFPKMDNLKSITCTSGGLTTLYVGQLKNLEVLDCSGNYIMTLDVTQNTKLKTLNCSGNSMYQLNVGEKPDLTSLDVSNNCLMGLDLEGAPQLKKAGDKLKLENQGVNPRQPEEQLNLWSETRSGTDYVGFDMSKILGVQCIGRIQNAVFPSFDDTSCFEPNSAKFETELDNWSYDKDPVLTYDYQVFGPSDNLIKMPVKLDFQYGQAFVFRFSYLEADGVTWKASNEFKQPDAWSSSTPVYAGQSFADKAPVPPDIPGYDFVGWDRPVDYVTHAGTFTAVYEEPSVPHTVTFKDYDGTTIGQPQEVPHGGTALAPELPNHDGLTFLKWDKSLENITSDDVIITARYTVSKFDDEAFRSFVWKEVLGSRADPFDNTLTDKHNIYTSDLQVIEKYTRIEGLALAGVANLNGIEYFKGLESLSIYGDKISVTINSIDLSKNTKLKYLQLFGFDLEELELGNNPTPMLVRVYDTKLKSLDVSGCRIGTEDKIVNDLGDLDLKNNALESLTLGNQPLLVTAFIEDNPKLGNIDVTDCPELVKLMLGNTGTTAINVTENPKLKVLNVSYNMLTTLNVTENPLLETLVLTGGTPEHTQMWGNKVRDLNLSKNPQLRTLQCEFNEIKKLNLEQNRNLVNVYCQGNEFTSLDMSLAEGLQILNCSGNKLNTLDVHVNTKLQKLNCSANESISTLDLSSNPDLAELICSGMNLQTLDLSDQSKLQYLACSNNSLYQLDLHPDAFDIKVTPPLGVKSGIIINPQKPRTINPLLNAENNKFEYDVNTLFGVSTLIPAPIDNVSFGTDLADHGTYDTTSKRIAFDTYNVTPFTYQYSTGNAQTVNANSSEFLKVMLTPNFGTFYKVTYHDGEKNLLEAEAPENGTLTRPSGIPGSKTGYQFGGWYQDPGLTVPWNFATDTVTANLDLYAKWTQTEYTVTFDSVGGSAVLPAEKLHYDDLVQEPSGVVLPGKTLTGWYLEADYKNKWDFATDKLTDNMKLYAKWQDKKYVVQYDTGSVDVASIPEKTNVLYGDASLLPSDPVRTGYDFAGWKCGETPVTAATKYKELVVDDTVGSITLEAQWTAHHFTVNYDTKFADVTVGPKTNVTWDEANLLPEAPVKAGQTFNGWKSNGNVLTSETKYKDLTTEAADGTEITLDADWTAKKYVVNYVTNSPETPTIAVKQNVLYEDASLLPPDPVRTGYDFAGWKCGETPVTAATKYRELVADDTVGSIALEAQWTAHHFSISYDSNGGSPVSNKTNVIWEDAGLLPENNPARPGFGFNGWYLNGNEVTSDKQYKDLTSVATDATSITFTADWIELTDYSVQYAPEGGNMPDGTDLVVTNMKYADEVSLPTPIRPGFTFDGWEFDKTIVGVGSKYSDLEADDTIKLITLTASWTEREDYSVIYSMDGGVMPDGSPTQTDNMKYSGIVNTPIPIKPGFSFGGWTYKNVPVAAGSKYSALEADDAVNSLTLAANWTKMQDYSVEYLLNEGTMPNGEPTLIEGMAFADLVPTPAPVRTGFKFNGWLYNDKLVSKGSLYSGNAANDTIKKMSLSASWTEREDYSITYVMDGGVMPDGKPAQISNMKYSDIVETPVPVKPGFLFKGWTYKNKPVADAQTYETLVQDDSITQIELAAVWQIRTDYGISYTLDGGQMPDGVPDKIENLKFADVVQTPKPVRKGFTFEGWKYGLMTISDGILYGAVAEDDTVTTLVLTAQWKANHYTVKYETGVEGISVEEKTDVTWDQAGLLPLNLKRPGYGIKNWSMGEKTVSAETKYSDLALDDMEGTSILLTVKWIELEDYSIIYDVDGGTMPAGTDLSETGLKYVGKVLLPEPTKTGHTFQHWSYQNTKVKAGSKYSDLTKNDEIKTLELKAVWKADTYKVSYAFVGDVPNGMQTPEDITVDYGSKVSAPTIKEQKGWTFSGWYTDKDCTKQYNFNTLISGDLKLYGKWSYSGKTQIPGGEGGIGNTSSVPTGDTNNLALLFALSLLSGIMVIVLVRKRKKNNAKDFRENP